VQINFLYQKKRAKKPREATASESLTKIELLPEVPAMQVPVVFVLALIYNAFAVELMF
jgi:hypothetical protein